jgi:hypothetical protein
MIGRSERERDLEKWVEGTWGPERREQMFKRLAMVAAVVVISGLALFVVFVSFQTTVDEHYAVAFSASSELYVGQLDLSGPAWDSLMESEITLTLDIPDWGIHEVRELTYFNRSSGGQRLDFFRMAPLSGQLSGEKDRAEADFTLKVRIVTASPEVNDLKFLGRSNTITGKVSNHPDKPPVELISSAKGVRLKDGDKVIEVRNEPYRDDIEYWFLQFTRTRLS